MLHEDRIVTYAELDAGANRFARWAHAQGLRKGDVVSLLMENRPEYLMAWIGLIKNGCIAALINTHLTGPALSHSINIAGAKHLILGGELIDSYASAGLGVEVPPRLWATGGAAQGCEDLDAALAEQSGEPLAQARATTSIAATRRSTSTPRARPACPKPPTSATCGCSTS